MHNEADAMQAVLAAKAKRVLKGKAQSFVDKGRPTGAWLTDEVIRDLLELREHPELWFDIQSMLRDVRMEDVVLSRMEEVSNYSRMAPIVHWRDLPDMPEDIWIVDRLVRRGSLSIFAGDPKVGKSTLIAGMISAILTQRPFIKRATTPCRVLYYALEEIGAEVKERFNRYLTGEEPLYVREGYVPPSQFLKILEEDITQTEAEFILIDPLFDILNLENTNEYVQVNNALKALLQVARRRNVHISVIHHAAKSGGILGSQALRGSTDLNMYATVVSRNEAKADPMVHEGQRIFYAEVRYGEAIARHIYTLDGELHVHFDDLLEGDPL